MKAKLFDLSAYPGKYLPQNSLVHRCPAGLKAVAATVLSCLAFLTRSYPPALALMAACFAGYALARIRPLEFWRDFKILLYQYPVVLILFLLRYDTDYALYRSGLVSLQIAMAFLPALLLQRTTRPTDLMHAMSRIMPYKLSFVLFTCLRFLPLLAREAKAVYMVQALRGARIAPKQLINPRNWGDAVHCLVLPLTVRMLKMATDAAVSAQARGFGERK